MRKQRPDEPSIQFQLDAWREVEGFLLPHEVRIDDGERLFVYRYAAVRLNRDSMATFRAPDSVLTEEQKLLRLHRRIMDDHLFGRADAMKAMSADAVTVVSSGEVQVLAAADWNAQLDQILSSRNYSVYEDRIRPIVQVSPDGTLGWVMAQVSAAGMRLDPDGRATAPLEFVSAWIELYEKVDGQWRMTGNVSNFRPERRPRCGATVSWALEPIVTDMRVAVGATGCSRVSRHEGPVSPCMSCLGLNASTS